MDQSSNGIFCDDVEMNNDDGNLKYGVVESSFKNKLG